MCIRTLTQARARARVHVTHTRALDIVVLRIESPIAQLLYIPTSYTGNRILPSAHVYKADCVYIPNSEKKVTRLVRDRV